MLRTFYQTESEIPENLKGAYVARDGRFVLDDLSEDHPVVVNKKQALIDKSNAVSRADGLQADLDAAKQSSVPRGHVAVPRADQELLEKLKPLGTPEEITAKISEHKALKEETDRRKREDNLREVAKKLNYEPEAFIRLSNLPEFEIRGEGDKATVIAKVKDDKGVITEKQAQEFIESSSEIKPFLPALKAAGGTKVFGSPGSQSNTKTVFDKIREDAKTRDKQAGPDLNPMFSKIPGRVSAPAGE